MKTVCDTKKGGYIKTKEQAGTVGQQWQSVLNYVRNDDECTCNVYKFLRKHKRN